MSQLSYAEAMDVIGGLSNTSKMPWYSWSTSANDCQTGGKLQKVEGSVCSNCYACKGCYVFKSVKESHQRKLLALSDPRFEDAFVTVLENLYARGRKTYNFQGKVVKENRFRWHDSGDVQSVEHLEMLNRIALRLPYLRFWLPTKEAGYVGKFLKAHPEGFAANLTVRLSHPMIGQSFEKRPMGIPFSTVGFDGATQNCPAYHQEGQCLDCDACWRQDGDTNYPLH